MRVLIVDDYYDYAVTLKDWFELEGHIARYCMESPIAVEQALEFRPDWVVLDVRMPDKLGIDVYKDLSKLVDFPFSAVFYTNYYKDKEFMDELKNQRIPDNVIIPKTTDMKDDVINKLIPVLHAGYLRGGGNEMSNEELEFLNEESRQYFDDLSDKIKMNQVVLFAGAGLSRNAHRRGKNLSEIFPLWSDLTRCMLEKIYSYNKEKIEKEKHEYLNAADKYEVQFGRKPLMQLIKDSLKDSEFEPGDIHQLISLFDWEIITTNYDTLIERGFELSNKTYNLILSDSQLVNKEKPRIFKINGCIKHAEDQIILTSEDFRTFSEKKPLIELYVKKCFVESVVLFAGFSLDDPAFKMIHGWVRDRLLPSGHNRYAYSIQNKVDEPTRKIWYSRGIHIIELCPDGAQGEDLIKKRLFSFFYELYKRQINDSKSTGDMEKLDIQMDGKKLDDFEISLDKLLKKAKKLKKESKIQRPPIQIELANDFLKCIKKTSFQEIFTRVIGANEEQKSIELLDKLTQLLDDYFFDKQKDNILFQFLKEITILIEKNGERLYEEKKITEWIQRFLILFFKDKTSKIDDPNIWVMALYMALRIGISQPLLPITFFKEGFDVIRETALKGTSEQKVDPELHRYWLFSVILTGNFRCAETLLDISRNIKPQIYPWDIDEFIRFHLEVFFDDYSKCRELFLRTVNKLRTSSKTESFFKFYLLDTFLKMFSKKGEYKDLLLNSTYRELYGRFHEESLQFKDVISSLTFPARENYFKSAVQAVFNAVNQGKSLMFTGLADTILSAPVLTIEKKDIELLKKTALGEFFLILLICDKRREGKKKELEFKRLMTLFIDSGIINVSHFLDLLILRLEGTDLERIRQGEDNGVSRFLTGLTIFIECALPSMKEDDFVKIKEMIERHLLQVKLEDIRERMVGIIGYLLKQFPEEKQKEFKKVLNSIFLIATRGYSASLGLKYLTLTNKELGKPGIVKYSQIRLIFDQSFEKEGTEFDKDFIGFLLKHKPEDLFENYQLVKEIFRYFFDSRIKEAKNLSFQWLMDLQQYIEKKFITLDDDMKKIIPRFIDKAFENNKILREWVIFSERMTAVYETLAAFFSVEQIRNVIDEFYITKMKPSTKCNLAHFLKVVYFTGKHTELKDFILEKIIEFVAENQTGGGYLGAFRSELNDVEQKKLSASMLDLWAPSSEKDILEAIASTGEFLKYYIKSPDDDELSNRILYSIFAGSNAVKIGWIKVIAEHFKENTTWFQAHKGRILKSLEYLKSEKDLSALREYVNLLALFKKKEVEPLFRYLKENASYAEIRRFAAFRTPK